MTNNKTTFRLRMPLLAALFSCSAALAADAAPAGYDAAYQAGYRAALEAAKKALAEGRKLDEIAPTAPAAGELGPSAATGAGPVAVAPPAGGAAKGKEPPDWWNHSSLAFGLKPNDEWRHTLQVQLSGVSLSGNEEGDAWRGGGKFFSRSGRFTNELSATIDKREINSAGGAVNKRDYRLLQESLRYDLTDRWYVSGGFMLERDDMSLIDKRTTLLAGPGYYWLDNEKFRLNTFLGYGRVDEKYMAYVRDHVGIDKRDSGLLYFYETFSWQFTENWGLRQGYRLMQDLDKSGHYVFDPVNSIPPNATYPRGFERYMADKWVERYRTVSAIDIDYRLSPRSVVSFGVETRYDSNPWPDVIRRDRTKRITLNLAF
jgi:hypothetical protein